MIERHLQTIFCDDIRQEDNGKLLLVGVYSDDLIAASFPITVPKFCVAVKAVTPVDNPFAELKFQLFKNDELFYESSASSDQLKLHTKRDPGLGDSVEQVQAVQLFYITSPMTFEEPMLIRVKAIAGDGELRGIGLRVREGQRQQKIKATS